MTRSIESAILKNESLRTVVFALAANLGTALAKLAGALLTGSQRRIQLSWLMYGREKICRVSVLAGYDRLAPAIDALAGREVKCGLTPR